MTDGRVTCEVRDGVARLLIDRPSARNAMTFAMYDDLAGLCAELAPRRDLVAITLRGAGDAFAAGTDIAEFLVFSDGLDGLAYEARIEEVVAAVERLPAPTVALVDGPAMGGGLLLATACDLRLLTGRARLGAPIARTVGNSLSSRNLARLERAFGLPVLQRLLLLAETLGAEEAAALGYAPAPVAPEALDEAAETLCHRLAGQSRSSLAALREGLRRTGRGDLQDDDLIVAAYGSPDFREGVAAFTSGRRASWPSAQGGGAR